MLPDFGWTELLLIAIVLIVVVGPKDLPRVLRGFSKSLGAVRKQAGEFRKQFDDALADAELDDLKTLASDVKDMNPRNQIKDALNPLGEVGKEINNELKGVKNAIDGDDLPEPKIEPSKQLTPEESYPQLAAMRKDIEAENAAKAAAAKKAATAAQKKTASKTKNTAKANKNAAKTSAKRMTTAKPAKAAPAKTAKPKTTSAKTKADLDAAKRSAAAKKAAATRARNKAAANAKAGDA